MWPTPRALYSSAAKRVSGVRRSAVSGRPSSLLNEPCGASVGAEAGEHLREQVLGRGLAAAAGDADGERLRRPGVRAARQRLQRRERVGHDQARDAVDRPGGERRDGAGARPPRRRGRGRRTRSPRSATNSEPGPHEPAVDLDVGGDRGRGRGPDDGGAGEPDHLVDVEGDHADHLAQHLAQHGRGRRTA